MLDAQVIATVYQELDSMRIPGRCHFCTSDVDFTTYDCPDFDVPVGEQDQARHRFEGPWLACRQCHALIEANEFTPLLQRACQLRRETAEITGAVLAGTRGDRNLAIHAALRGFMVATPSAPWRRDLVALSDGAVSLGRLNPTHSYQIQLELRDGVGGETELYLFGGTPSEIERQLISLPPPAARRVSLVQITLGFDLYPVKLPMEMESRV